MVTESKHSTPHPLSLAGIAVENERRRAERESGVDLSDCTHLDDFIAEQNEDPEFRLRYVLAQLRAQAERMQSECKNPPCRHAWGIHHAVGTIEEVMFDA